MNGIHAVVLATGNDTRGAGKSAHAYASRDGQYKLLRLGSLIKNVVA